MAQYKSPFSLSHTGCALAQLWRQSQERDRCELTILLQKRMCQAGSLQDVTGKATHGRDRSISWSQQEGSRSKLCWRFSTQGVAVAQAHWHSPCWAQLLPTPAQPLCPFQCTSPRIHRNHAGSSAHSKPTQGFCNPRLQCQHTPPCPLWLGLTCELPRNRLCWDPWVYPVHFSPI